MNYANQSLIPASAPGAAAALTRREIASGSGWCVSDVAYAAGDRNQPLRDQHGFMSITTVVAGSFRYRSTHGSAMLVPGALLLGNAGSGYECTFEHAPGDRCIHFAYTPEYFEKIAKGVPGAKTTEFRIHRVPPVPAILPLAARAELQKAVHDRESWEELSLAVAGEVLGLVAGDSQPGRPRSCRDEQRVSDALKLIETRYVEPLSIAELASAACMSPYHFMRTFRDVVGVTAYQYLLQTRLRHAAIGLGTTSEQISAIAFGVGFGDLSTFAEAFRRTFHLTPGQYRIAVGAGLPSASIPQRRGRR
jgi:AraC family transcriptional regulator